MTGIKTPSANRGCWASAAPSHCTGSDMLSIGIVWLRNDAAGKWVGSFVPGRYCPLDP